MMKAKMKMKNTAEREEDILKCCEVITITVRLLGTFIRRSVGFACGLRGLIGFYLNVFLQIMCIVDIMSETELGFKYLLCL